MSNRYSSDEIFPNLSQDEKLVRWRWLYNDNNIAALLHFVWNTTWVIGRLYKSEDTALSLIGVIMRSNCKL